LACVWWAFRAEGRRRFASWLALAALVALVGGTVLTGASAARRTEAAYPDFLSRYGYDAELYTSAPELPATVRSWHYIATIIPTAFYLSANVHADGQLIPASPLLITALTPTIESHVVRLTSGRLPTRTDEIAVGYATQQQFHLHLGSTVVVPLYALRQRQEVFASSGTPPAHGAIMRFTVVGIAASVIDFPSTTPSYSLYVSPAFADTVGRRSVSATVAFARLRRGAADVPRFAYQANHLTVPGGFAGVQGNDDLTAATEGSIHPQAIGWWLFALFALLAGLALVGQALSRQSTIAREANPPLSAVGMRPIQLASIGMARAGVVGLAGAAGAMAIATALSPLTPVGEARVAEPQSGVVVDPLVFGLGGLTIVVVVLLLGAVPAWRSGQVRRFQLRDERAVGGGASRIAAALARAGAGASVLVGVRHALERGRGRTSVPVATALVGTAGAVAALVATSVFGASLSTLLSTPRLYGQDFQVVLSNLTWPQVQGITEHLRHDPGAERVSYASLGKYVTINGVPTEATLVVAAKGPLVFSLVDGRDPTGNGQVALGTQTLRAIGASIGSTVRVSVIGPTGRSTTSQFRVVGTMAFPPSVSSGGGLGTGAVVTLDAAVSAVCGPGPRASTCRAEIQNKLINPKNTDWGLAVRVAPDAAGSATREALVTRFSQQSTPLSVPTNLVNFGEAVNFPALLGATLAVFGAATLAHLLLASASRRRREFALLKVLGFVHRQVRSAVGWQATTVAVIGIVVGVPLGVALGSITWRAFASNLGAVPLTVVSVGTVALIALGVLVVGNLLAVVPAGFASRARPAAALRQE
jgi:ABC-type lipoprotein release transport system permease subunit